MEGAGTNTNVLLDGFGKPIKVFTRDAERAQETQLAAEYVNYIVLDLNNVRWTDHL